MLIPVVTNPKKAAGALNWAVQEMVERYRLFSETGVRDLASYNKAVERNENENLVKMPHIVIIIDELSDLMMVAPHEVEDAICRLAQMARAAGMHLVIATQRPSVDVITGVIKANIPSRIAFAVSSQVDSRTILDCAGAEKLLGKGDMLFYPVGEPKPIRIQGALVTESEVEKVVEFLKKHGTAEYDEDIIEEIDSDESTADSSNDVDELLPQAIETVIEAGQASVSLIQRKYRVGYARAARIIDQMEARGIIGGFEGSKPRQVLISKQQWLEMENRFRK
jgi:S-DNA-T family DNA segregation ATPase FtsK/SpoIIIE